MSTVYHTTAPEMRTYRDMEIEKERERETERRKMDIERKRDEEGAREGYIYRDSDREI